MTQQPIKFGYKGFIAYVCKVERRSGNVVKVHYDYWDSMDDEEGRNAFRPADDKERDEIMDFLQDMEPKKVIGFDET